MFSRAIKRNRSRGPITGIIIATIFITVAFSLIRRWNEVGTEAAVTNNGPTVVDSIQEWEEFTTQVEGRNIQIRALKGERIQLLRIPQPEPQPEVKVEPVTAPTQDPPPEEDIVTAPDEQTMGEQQATESTPTPIPTATPLPVVVVASTATPQPIIAFDPNSSLIGFRQHTVQAGETLFRLTQTYAGTNLDMLARHGITEADMIVGNVIQVPFANGAACSTGRACPIAAGDTLYSLARLHNTTVLNLQQLNGIGQDFAISAGHAICVP